VDISYCNELKLKKRLVEISQPKRCKQHLNNLAFVIRKSIIVFVIFFFTKSKFYKQKNVVELCYISTVFVFPSLSRGVLTVSPFILHVDNTYTHRIYSFERSTTGSEI
jgi:hypothetical protein